MLTVAEPLPLVPRSGAAATLCRMDLYVVGSRQIFTVKIQDVVGVVILPRSTDQENK